MYKVEKTQDKNGLAWIVRCPDGSIANDCQHPNKKDAEKHCEILNSLFGEENEK